MTSVSPPGTNAGAPRRNRLLALAAVVGPVFVLPVLLLLAGVIPFAYRFHTLVVMMLAVGAGAGAAGFGWSELGLGRRHMLPSLLWNALVSGLLVAVLVVVYASGGVRPAELPEWNLFFVFYVFVSSPCQELLYRGFLFALMDRWGPRSAVAQVLLSAMLYSFLHLFYRDLITLAVTLVMGLVWGAIYRRHRNLWPVMGSHAVLGAVSILTGLV